ncbi:hypothetical protein LCGC14_2093450 [marine sediment metagenome]|uniref:Uncharacterized protein n=1 Tax=marine sediment metagenome TaxID=412755 RepID=A0A0F9GQ43_9ZZZZ
MERLRREKAALTQRQIIELAGLKRAGQIRAVEEARVRQKEERRVVGIKERIVEPKVRRDTLKKKVKRFGVSLVTPAVAPSEIKELPKEERGLEAAKGIFLGGFEGLYQAAKRGTREVSVKIPVHTGIFTPIVGKQPPIDLGRVKPSQVVAEFIPRTTAEVVLLRFFPKLPKIVRVGVTGIVTGVGIAGAADVSRTKEERIASGIIGVGAGFGTVAQFAPYVRGLKAQTIGRVTGKFKPTKVQPEGFKAVQLKETRIGLIPEKAPLKTGLTKEVKLPIVSPLKRGGFGVKPFEKKLFLGKEQIVATSQIGLFRKGKVIKPTPSAPTEFFVTPQEPSLKIPETRISRLGLESLFKFPKKAKLGVGLPKKPQIGLEFGAKVGRVERGGAFRIGTGTELEAIKTLPTITVQKKLGITTIKGQAIDIFKIKTTPTKGIGKVPSVPTTEGITRISLRKEYIYKNLFFSHPFKNIL